MLNPILLEIIACPRCKGELETSPEIYCRDCRTNFPTVDEIPVLINEENSLFRIEDFTEHRETTYRASESKLKKFIDNWLPSINLNVRSAENFRKISERLRSEKSRPCILVIGGAVEGEGFQIEQVFSDDLTLIETDVAFGRRTGLICDAHDLPFKEQSFDGVIVQAVLEHVLDPARCVAEICRVLKNDGFVYAETPFMQQVHAGRFDFTRFTHLGHRRLFRRFEEIESGATCGAGMALAWSYCYFLQGFFYHPKWRKMAFAVGRLTGFWLKYFDYWLVRKNGSYDSASSFYFWGRKSAEILDDKKLIAGYKGLIQ